VWHAGADTFVAGNAIFKATDPRAELRALRAKCAVAA
jgi:pentose-5-phosphate-3-epimerase